MILRGMSSRLARVYDCKLLELEFMARAMYNELKQILPNTYPLDVLDLEHSNKPLTKLKDSRN